MKVFSLIVLLSCLGAWVDALPLPGWIVPLREAVYEQKLTASEIRPIYQSALAASRKNCSGAALDVALSRCEYFMGRAFLYEERKTESDFHFSEGMNLAEKALKTAQSADAWQMLAENLSQLCTVRSTVFVMANGLNVEKFAKNALSLDSRNAAAQILIAARWVYAPAPFHNHERGIEMMKKIPQNSNMEKDDTFNVYLSIGYTYIQQKKFAEARLALQKALEIYPSNKYARELFALANK
jgi:tetratricopeptide (TPR) repeat protein